MKTKMQFKGYVNGTEYSDPQAYNDALQKAIDDGTLRSTSSCTQAVTCSDNMLMTPGFNPVRLGHKYLDEDDKDLPDTLKEIGDSIENMDDAEKQAYKDSVSEITKYLREDEKKMKVEMEKLQNRMKRISEFMEKNSNFSNFYGSVGKLLMADDKETSKDDSKETSKNAPKEEPEEKKPCGCEPNKPSRGVSFDDLFDSLFRW